MFLILWLTVWVKQFVSVIWQNKEETTFAKEYTFWNPSKTCQNISWERHLGSYSNRKLIYFIMSEKKFPPDPSEKADVLLSNKAINFQNISYAVCFPSNTMYIYNFQGRNSHLSSVQSCYQISFSLQVLLSVVSIMSFEQQYHGIYQWDGPWISWKHLTLGFCLSFFFSFLFFIIIMGRVVFWGLYVFLGLCFGYPLSIYRPSSAYPGPVRGAAT